MFGSFIIGAIFGFGSKYVADPVSAFVASKVSLSEKEMAIVVFGLVMAVASIVASIVTGDGSPFWLILGGVIGVFATQLFAVAKEQLVDAKTGAEKAAETTVEHADPAMDATGEAVADAGKAAKDAADEAVETVTETVKDAAKN